MNSHAQVPYTVLHEDFIRVYFSTRERADANNQFRSFSGFVDLDRENPKKILKVSDAPILQLGGLGEFDEFGSMAGSVIKHNNLYYLYYCGWQRQVSTPYNWAIGLATSTDGEKFIKNGRGPLLGPTLDEPYLQACPIVYKLDEHDWHMFYLSGIKWIEINGKKESQYLLMHAVSNDGIHWARDGKPIIPTIVDDECQTSASIIERHGRYHMFLSYRFGTSFRDDSERGYRIGYAWSDDLKNWHRDDTKAGLDISQEGWDSEMVAYPHVVEVNSKTLMFYCGNYFGIEGFGYAILEEI